MTVAENLLFGTPKDRTFDPENLAGNTYVRKVLDDVGLMDDFVDIGRNVASVMVDLFADVAPGSELFEQFSFISAEDLPEFRSLLARTESERASDLEDADRTMFLSLTFKLVPARHRLGLIDEPMQERLVLARRRFSEGFEAGETPIEFFDSERYNSSVSILDNILFGRLAYGRQRSAARINEMIGEVVDALGLRRPDHRERARLSRRYRGLAAFLGAAPEAGDGTRGAEAPRRARRRSRDRAARCLVADSNPR